jgi:hypothetical protein
MSFAPGNEPLAKPEALLRVPVGLSSPLWGLFAGAAMSGAAWWWMTRWTRPENLEAMFGAATKAEAAIEPQITTLASPVVEAIGETEPAAIVEAMAEASVAPVGGEAAPISPVLEAMAAEVAEPTAAEAETATPEKALEASKEVVAEMTPKLKKSPASKPT